MKNIAEQILEGLSKFYVGFQNRRVLKTMEEIEANTDEQNIPSALLLGEINNKLMLQPEFVYDSNGKITGYKTGGADTVHPFINTKSVVLHCTSTANVVGWGNASSTYDIVINLETKTCSIINYTGKDLSGSATTTKAPTTSISSAGFNN